MIPPGDPVLEDLRFLSLESGKPFLSFTPPLAPHEVEQFLNSLDPSLLSDPGKDAFNRAHERLNPQARLSYSIDSFSMQLRVNSTIETRVRTNEEIAWYPQYPKIPSLLSFPVSFYFAGSVQLYIEPSLKIDPEHYLNAKIFGLNSTLDIAKYDFSMPLRAYGAAGGAWWNFQLGRDRISYGTGELGNLAVSDNPDYYDFARLSLFSRIFKYSFLISQIPLEINDDLYILKDETSLWRTMNRH
jgi:hypothetical protein